MSASLMSRKRTVGTNSIPISFAAAIRPWPAMTPLFSSTSTGLTNPKYRMEVAICAICFWQCVRGFVARSTSADAG